MTLFKEEICMSRKILLVSFALALVMGMSLGFVGCKPAEEMPEGEGVVKILVGTDAAYPPFENIDPDTGDIVGFDIDLMSEIAKEGGFEVEYVNVPWDGIFVGLKNGDYDAIISAVSITDERKLEYDFSDSYFAISQALIVRADMADAVGDLPDLTGKKIGAQMGTTGAIFISKQDMVELVNYDDNTLAIEALTRGDVDGVVCDHPVAYEYALVSEAYKGKLVVVNDDLNKGDYEPYGIVVKKGNTEVLDMINKGLAGVSDKTKEKIAKKWKLTD
jgi:polar amino acid transport system substrate-binding protein